MYVLVDGFGVCPQEHETSNDWVTFERAGVKRISLKWSGNTFFSLVMQMRYSRLIITLRRFRLLIFF
jgi:hypothetical protein